MSRVQIALRPKDPLPPLPTQPHPNPSPLQQYIAQTVASTDYDAICLPLTNGRWQDRWERLCLRPMDDDDALAEPDIPVGERSLERAETDREADEWRKDPALRRDECNITRLEEAPAIVAMASDWLELDSPDEGIRFDSELGLRAEVAQALYLSLPVLVLPAPNLANRAWLPSYARVINGLLQMGGNKGQAAFTQISVRIPISDPFEIIGQGPGPANGDKNHRRVSSLSSRPTSMHAHQLAALGPISASSNLPPNASHRSESGRNLSHTALQGDPSSTWEMWDCLRSMCGYHPRLTVMLDLTNPLPPSVGALSRWTAEPVKHIWVPASAFIPNAKGYPVLSKACQAFIRGMLRQNPTYIIADTYTSRHPSGGPNAYLQYLRHITSQAQVSLPGGISPQGPADFANGYGDFLQSPLQPLMDDLSSATYDVFERDPVKYRQYEEAIYLAVIERVQIHPPEEPLALVIAGAGRGPLVSCTLRALARAQVAANVYAVEKNPNAFTTLQERRDLEWGDNVELIFGDMRTAPIPEEADILISELLGSFGDNELSPECIDGGMRFLKPDGVSIPTSYTAHLAPISSSKLYQDVSQTTRPAGADETPYVVMMQQVNLLSGDGGGLSGRCGERIQQCWQFEHPRRDLILDVAGLPVTNSHNTRSARLTFHIPHASPCQGFAGFFEAHLYGNIGLSIHPDTAHRVSPDMFSWFPLFFPLKAPLYLPSGAELDVSIWRLADGRSRRVWYEWSAEAYLPAAATAGSAPATPARPPHSAATHAASPTMDAPYSPMPSLVGQQQADPAAQPDVGRVKIGQTVLHNPGGIHFSVGL